MRRIMPQAQRFSQLSPARQALVRIFQAVNFGEIQGVHVRDADPIFDFAGAARVNCCVGFNGPVSKKMSRR
jgi:hypothetical protein